MKGRAGADVGRRPPLPSRCIDVRECPRKETEESAVAIAERLENRLIFIVMANALGGAIRCSGEVTEDGMRKTPPLGNLGRFLGAAALLAAIAVPGEARAQPNDGAPKAGGEAPKASDDATKACVQAYESAQEDSKAELLLKARDELRACSAPSCPAILQSDCTNWLGQVVDSVPSVVFAAREGGENVFDVSVSMDGKPLAKELDGKPIEVDPGLHTFVFERGGAAPLEKKTIVAAREKAQLISVGWAAPPSVVAGPTQAPAEVVEKTRPVPPLFYVLGATTVVGFGTFGIVGATAESTKSDLQKSCSPHCSSSDVSSLKTHFLIADIAAGVGAASAAGALVVILTRPERDKPRQVGLSTFGVSGVDHGAQFQWAGWF